MNAGVADTRSPHLEIEDLVAEVTGQAIDSQVREHLTRCAQCRTEANRWGLVASGVRGLAAAPQTAWPARPRRIRGRVLAGQWRGAMLAAGSAAVALVLLVGVGEVTGYVRSVSGPGTRSPGAETALTAVTGCAALKQASGTLEQVTGGSLVIKTGSGQPVTVTTTASTKVGEVGASGTLLGDIRDGASVTVVGQTFDGTIAALSILITSPAQQHPKPPPGMVVVKGAVSDASTSAFTVVTSDGTRIPVTTSGDTVVGVPNVSLSELPAGVTTLALGYAGPGGTLSAEGVVAILQLAQGNRQLHRQLHVKNCSPASVDSALAFGG